VKKKVINYYASFYEVSKELNQKQFYEFNNAIFSVMFYEQHIDGISFNDKMLNMLWLSIKHSLQASIDGYCSKNKIVYKDTLTKGVTKGVTKGLGKGLTNNDNDKGKDKGKDKENTQVRKLSAQDVINYCKERNNSIDGEYFFDYYESADWVKSNGQKVKDWKATVRMWEKREQNNKTEQQSQRKVLSR
jgi:hypothetical protein